MPSVPSRWSAWGFALTILLSSFLIFQVQPLISKYILPWYGGTPGVWTACMLFFQVLLFAGYAYAHLSIRTLTPAVQCGLHLGLIALALVLMPITPDASWKPAGPENPTWRILGLLMTCVGLPYFILSSTGPLLQAWFSRTSPGESPYRLYALSNLGSVAGLVSYPFLVEPALSAEAQALVWSWSFGLFALFCAVCAVRNWKFAAPQQDLPASAALEGGSTMAGGADQTPPAAGVRWLWFCLSACASIMLLATTNQVCLDVAVIPFLWVLPLSLYLVSFILCFDHERWYPRRMYACALALSMVCLCYLIYEGQNASVLAQIVVHFAALFFCCMVCHGELVRLKPSPKYLTSFYLSSSAGGAAGGVLVGLVAPFVFHRYIELHLGMLACCLMVLIVFFRDKNWVLYHGRPRWVWVCLIIGFFGLARALRAHAGEVLEGELTVSRNFYGVLRVTEGDTNDPAKHSRMLIHGRILHGRQPVAPERRRIPTAYYGEQSGAGLALRNCGPNKKVGVVGLGIGTLAAYGQPGDTFRFYEINQDVIRLAREYFTYIDDCQARTDLILGDARLSMESEPPQAFDVLVLDAFSSDAIPAHLLTQEAFAIYLKHLKPGGVIAVHITNRHFALQPVVAAAAEQFGLTAVKIHSQDNDERLQSRADWMLVTRDKALLATPDIAAATLATETSSRRVRLWTDNHSNMIEIMK